MAITTTIKGAISGTSRLLGPSPSPSNRLTKETWTKAVEDKVNQLLAEKVAVSMLLIHYEDGLSSSWATSWKTSKFPKQLDGGATWPVSNRLMKQYIHAVSSQTKRRDNLGSSLQVEQVQHRHRNPQLWRRKSWSLNCRKPMLPGQQASKQEEAIRSCFRRCKIGRVWHRLPQVFLQSERCALDAELHTRRQI